MRTLMALLVLLVLGGCAATKVQRVYEGPRCFKDITLPGDTLYLKLEELYNK